MPQEEIYTMCWYDTKIIDLGVNNHVSCHRSEKHAQMWQNQVSEPKLEWKYKKVEG